MLLILNVIQIHVRLDLRVLLDLKLIVSDNLFFLELKLYYLIHLFISLSI